MNVTKRRQNSHITHDLVDLALPINIYDDAKAQIGTLYVLYVQM